MNMDHWALALGLGAARGARVLARSVGPKGLRVVALGDAIARALFEAGHEPLRSGFAGGQLSLPDGEADALCASGLPTLSADPTVLREFARVVKPGGRILLATAAGLVGRGPERQLLTALFMHAGLTGIQQQLVRGTVITSGGVRR